jgi:hypothetical protein
MIRAGLCYLRKDRLLVHSSSNALKMKEKDKFYEEAKSNVDRVRNGLAKP